MNETLEQLFHRKSVRAFEPRPVDPEMKELLLQAAFQAPTAGCQMLYTILDITEEDRKMELAELCDHQPFIATAPIVFVFLADGRRWLDVYAAAGCAARPMGLGDALLAMADATIAAQNMVVAAESFGLGTCYIGDILENCERIRALLDLPSDVFPAAMLVLGWPTEVQKNRRKPARFNRDSIVFENRYHRASALELEHMVVDREIRTGRANPDFASYVETFWNRKYESDFAREMNRSAEVYMKEFLDDTGHR